MKFYKCMKCGQILEAVVSKCDGITCCGEAVKELKANTTDGATEKHVPVVEVKGDVVKVCVGSAEHPMVDDHWIQFIEIETDKGAQRKVLNPGEKPEAEFTLNGEKFIAAYEYCNKHGLWKNN
ncbi:MAG: desulfoferrodoxin Dfx [Treponemataceae bacterium]|nr:desulfoferrodoxin Dfx [Treponemataceae bacterium]